jgi:hypothetical protein
MEFRVFWDASIEAVRTSETSVNFNVTTLRYIPEDSKLHTRRRENLKSHINKVVLKSYANTYEDSQTKQSRNLPYNVGESIFIII